MIRDDVGVAELFDEIRRLTQENRDRRNHDIERRLLLLRHLAGHRLKGEHAALPPFPEPDSDGLPASSGLPDFAPADMKPSLLRAAILRDGCMIVRGLVNRDKALRFASQIERAFAERERRQAGEQPADGYYEEFPLAAPYKAPVRRWIESCGGLLAVDSPMLAFELMEMFDASGVTELSGGYLGEPVISAEKTTLRKCEPGAGAAWHQDGAFMGNVRSLNVWVSLSHCGDDAPGLNIVPRRLNALVETGTEGAFFADQVSQAKAEEAAGDHAIMRPIFEPGDAVLFDDLFLHSTGTDESMTKTRYAVESWFFAGAGFPGEYAPIALPRPASAR
jgi:hypothetical protein